MFSAWFGQSSGMLFFAAAITILAKGNGWINNLLSTNVMVKLGEISFATYMIHPIVIALYQRQQFGLTHGQDAVIVIATVYALSYAIYTFYEEPVRALVTGRKRTQAPPSAHAAT